MTEAIKNMIGNLAQVSAVKFAGGERDA